MKEKIRKALCIIMAAAMAFSVPMALPKEVKAADAVIDDYSDYKFGDKISVEFVKDGIKSFYWKVELATSGTLKITGSAYTPFNLLFYDNEANKVYKKESVSGNSDGVGVGETIRLNSGVYYLGLERYASRYGKVNISMTFESANETFKETYSGNNNTMDTASAIDFEKMYTGLIAYNDTLDMYKFTMPKAGAVILKIVSPMDVLSPKVLDANGNKVWDPYSCSKDSTKNMIMVDKVLELQAGVHYVAIQRYASRDFGTYQVGVYKLTQANCPHKEYKSTTIDPTYFARGYKKYTCPVCGKTYNAEYTAVKKLTKGALSYMCKGAKKSLKLSWSSVSGASGYQIRYSKKKNMKKAKTVTVKGGSKTSKTIKKLSRKKKYYVQVRAYVKSGKATAYGAWSGKKTIKTK